MKARLYKGIALLLTICIMLCAVPSVFAGQFADVKDNTWYTDAVQYCLANKLMAGITDTHFAPQGTVTREMVVAVLYRLAGSPAVSSTDSFVDVPEGRWFTTPIAWAKETQLASGYNDGTFGLGKPVTREEMVAFFNRFAYRNQKYTEAACDLSNFIDADSVSPWALDDMETAMAVNLISGSKTDDGTALAPAGHTRRCELAMVLMNYNTRIGLELTMDEYLAKTEYTWFATGKTDYTIQGKMVSADTEVYNELEDVHYTAHPNGEDVILKGTVGEEWVTKLSKVIKTYTKPDGSALTAEDFVADTYIDLKTIPTTGNFACFVPAGTKVSVNTAWGDVLHVNRNGVPHGDGDYLVCAVGENGEPNLRFVWVVYGAIFPSTYDITNADSVELTLEEYLAQTTNSWFATGKIDYQIEGRTVSKNTYVYNWFENVSYIAQPNGSDVILNGTVSEKWVTRLSKVITTYTKIDGTALTESDFPADTVVSLRTIPSTGNFACFVPADTKVSVNTAWGDVLHVNRNGVPHGEGDYLVCAAGEDGKPNLSDVWVVNGTIFPNTYAMPRQEITMDEYLANTEFAWFATGKTDYVIQGKMVSADTEVYNELEDVHYTAHPNGKDVILKGTVGEEWVTKLSKVIKTYTKPDGSALTAEDFVADTYIDLKTIPTTGNFACFVPAGIKVSVNTAWGDVLHVNRDGVPHGDGDYLVCAVGKDGKPDLSDVWVVNGKIFPSTYDMTNAAK